MPSLILTLVGPDRPGLVSELSAQLAARGGSWLESRMARLAGQFAGIVRIDLPDPEAIAAAVAEIRAEGFSVTVHDADLGHDAASGHPTGAVHAMPEGALVTLSLLGQDRPGIVRDMAKALAAHAVNIEELTTNVESGSFSGETMFRAEARLRVPAPLTIAALREALEHLGPEFMVDIEMRTDPT